MSLTVMTEARDLGGKLAISAASSCACYSSEVCALFERGWASLPRANDAVPTAPCTVPVTVACSRQTAQTLLQLLLGSGSLPAPTASLQATTAVARRCCCCCESEFAVVRPLLAQLKHEALCLRDL